MHLPDGFLDTKVTIGTALLGGTALGFALRRARTVFPPRQVPLLGLAGAFVFAMQMLNFPIGGGTSGHMMGGVLTAVLLGPSAALIALSAVLIVQALFFADGGFTALGANIFNMAVVGTAGGFLVYEGLRRLITLFTGRNNETLNLRVTLVAAFIASFSAVVAASICCSGELALSGTVEWSVVYPLMSRFHFLIGLGEAVLTTFVLVSIARLRPELVHRERHARSALSLKGLEEFAVYGSLICLGLVVFVSPFASHCADGLEKTAEILGFSRLSEKAAEFQGLFPDYQLPGFSAGAGGALLASLVSGAIGISVLFIFLVYGMKTYLPRREAGESRYD